MNALDRLSRFWWVGLVAWLIVATLVFQVGPYPTLSASLESPLPEEQPGVSSESIRDFLTGLGERASLYARFQILDTLQAGLMGLAMVLVFHRAFARQWPTLGRWLHRPLLTLVGFQVVLDWLENTLLGLAVAKRGDTPVTAWVGTITTFKLIVGSVALIALVVTVMAIIVSNLRRRFRTVPTQ